MKTRIRYFASLRDALGLSEEYVALPPEVSSVADLRAWLRTRDGVWSEALDERRAVRAAVDQEMADEHASVAGAAEVAFLPPVTGG